jgi:glycosyltransferase involved in cell wall biosynthesis
VSDAGRISKLFGNGGNKLPGTNTGSRQSRNGSALGDQSQTFPIIVHCHLCWDWVWQRPQQFLSRLSQRHPILYVETVGPDPELLTPYARLRQVPDFPNIWLLRVQFPERCWSDGDYVDQERLRLVQQALSGPLAGRFDRPVQWFYDPMAVQAFAGNLHEIATVYDCMDELSQFRFAPPEIKRREQELLTRADVVFTGGRRLYEAKRQHNPNCHFYGCGVDVAHFSRARQADTAVPPDLAALPKPVLGYFGVIDERIDYDLIAALADAHPNWSIAMVGPVLKVDENSLPRRQNIHWLGRRAYEELPACAKAFDVCLMPFALNEATEYINPTKSLEYMATERPIVSSAVPDVVSNFGTVVKVARTPEEFIELCRAAIEAVDQEALQRGLAMAHENTWENIVAQLEGHILEILQTSATRQQQPYKSMTHAVL